MESDILFQPTPQHKSNHNYTRVSHPTLHSFPNPEKDRERFSQWVSSINGLEKEYLNYKNRKMCHVHFEDKYCCRFNKLSNIAVPTLHMPGPPMEPPIISKVESYDTQYSNAVKANMEYCRCCQSSDCVRDMENLYFFGGKCEVYSKMLLETFDINILPHNDTKCRICERCIARLRDAASFKTQVLATEQNILKLAALMAPCVVVPKVELEIEVDDDYDDRVKVSGDSDLTRGSGTEDADGEIFHIKIEYEKNHSTITENTTTAKTYSRTKPNETVLTKTRTKPTKVKWTPTHVEANKEKHSKKNFTELSIDKDRRINTLKLLQNSNMCLFRSLRNKYGCYACKETFIDIKALRKHTTTHTNTKCLISRINRMRGLSARFKNVDVSDLKCNRCNEKCTNLFDLRNHLTIKHNIDFSSNEHLLKPYRMKD